MDVTTGLRISISILRPLPDIGKGTAMIPKQVNKDTVAKEFQNVLLVPELRRNLFSIVCCKYPLRASHQESQERTFGLEQHQETHSRNWDHGPVNPLKPPDTWPRDGEA